MARHPAVLVTGMSGVGKSTALDELAVRGFTAVDTDDGPWIHVVDGEPLWRQSLINDLLDQPRESALFVQGTVANQGSFYHRFDAIVLLSAPVDVVFHRLEQRTNNPFGKSPNERQRIANDIAEIEPLLRQAATHEIDTSRPLAEVVDRLIGIAREVAIDSPQFIAVRQDDPLAAPLLDELTFEYNARYGDWLPQEYTDLRAYPADEFAPPGGALVVAVVNSEPVAGGAFRHFDTSTAELKRIWTATAHRRKGYGKLIVAELERIARERGYTRIYLTTGPRQPEAVALYLSTGYAPLYDLSLPAEEIGTHAFEKLLPNVIAPQQF